MRGRTMTLAFASIVAVTTTPAATAKVGCAADRPRSCANVNQLIWLAPFKAAVRTFAWKWPGPYGPARGLAADALAAFGGAPDDRRDLADGRSLFAACRPRECTEKAAVLLDARGRVLALTLFVSDRATAALHHYRKGPVTREDQDAIDVWAKAAASADGLRLIATVEHGTRDR